MSEILYHIENCNLLRNHSIVFDDLWIRNGKIIDPEKVFFDEKAKANKKIDMKGNLIVPGFIDIQINGAFGIDFSYNVNDVEKGLETVAKGILAHGVTAFCPTMVTSPPHVYSKVLPYIKKRPGGIRGAEILGVHVEGPFINEEKRGAHAIEDIKELKKGLESLEEIYGSLENIKIVTLAPEKMNGMEVIKHLACRNITVSLGHSMAGIEVGEEANRKGATLITHLFNAMLPFHHRDPGLVGLLASDRVNPIFYGVIADGVHTHPATLRIAHRSHPEGVVLVTDAISAMGLPEGTHHIGQMAVEIKGDHAYIANTSTLCGSVATMDKCVKYFKKAACCSLVEALEAASLHPATALNIQDKKGTLNYGADADFVVLNDELDILATFIAGTCVYRSEKFLDFPFLL